MQFKDVVGQEGIKQMLINYIQKDSIPHALLFLGKAGYGGLPLSIAFIQYLMCENRGEKDSCGECKECRRVGEMMHPDVHFTFPTVQAMSKTSDELFPQWKEAIQKQPLLNLYKWIALSDEKGRKPLISVYQSEAIIKKLNLTSFEGGYKVSILWMASEMNLECANKLLKIIEEPPKKTIFILLAESEAKILPTILSRTQIINMKPLLDTEMVDYLSNKVDYSGDQLDSIVARSNGDLSVALDILETGDKNNAFFDYFVEMMRVCYQKKPIAMMDWAAKVAKLGREEQKQFLVYSTYMVRQSLMQNYTQQKLTHTSETEAQFLSKFAQFITGNNITKFYNLLSDAQYHVERNAHSKLLFTNLSFKVMRYIHNA